MRKREGYIIWPEYFDSSKPRKWRRVSKSLSVDKPTIEEIKDAAVKAGLTVIVDPEAKHPGFWFDSRGRLIVKAQMKKSAVIKTIALHLKKIREEKTRSKKR
jgi:signal recognition particle subunit SRP19